MRRFLRWLREPTYRDAAPGEVVTVSVGSDVHRANLVAEACAARGLHVELLTSEMAAHPHTPGIEQSLLVRAEDLDAVRAVIAEGE